MTKDHGQNQTANVATSHVHWRHREVRSFRLRTQLHVRGRDDDDCHDNACGDDESELAVYWPVLHAVLILASSTLGFFFLPNPTPSDIPQFVFVVLCGFQARADGVNHHGWKHNVQTRRPSPRPHVLFNRS